MTLHLVCAGVDRRLWHTIRREDGSWFGLGPVCEEVLQEHPGSPDLRNTFIGVACAAAPPNAFNAGVLGVLGLAEDNILLTRREANGNWSQFFPIFPIGLSSCDAVGVVDIGGGLRIGAVITKQ